VYGFSAVPGPPAAPVISNIISTSCTVKCEAPEIQEGGPPVTGYLLEVRTLSKCDKGEISDESVEVKTFSSTNNLTEAESVDERKTQETGGKEFLAYKTPVVPWITVNKTPITVTEVRVTQLHSDIRYKFRLTAINDNGLGECSTASGPVVPLIENRPSQPGQPVATVSGTSVNLEWSMLDGDSETKHLRYVIRCREANRERTIVYASTERKAGATLHHTLSNVMLKPDTDYEFAVAACNTAGLGPYSSYSECVKTPSG